MSTWLKTLVVLVLVVPMTAYVVGSLSSSGAGDPGDRGPVILEDPSVPASPPARGPTRDKPAEDDDANPRDDHTARVVTPQPIPVDDDDDAPTDDDRTDDNAPPDERNDDSFEDDDDTDGDDDDDGDDEGDD